MKTLTLNAFLVAALLAVMVAGGTIAQAATLEGAVQGYQCFAVKKLCAVDQNDPRVAAEKNYVIVLKDGSSYFITNVDASILAKNIYKDVRITGDINNKYNTVTADKVESYSHGAWNEAWSTADMEPGPWRRVKSNLVKF